MRAAYGIPHAARCCDTRRAIGIAPGHPATARTVGGSVVFCIVRDHHPIGRESSSTVEAGTATICIPPEYAPPNTPASSAVHDTAAAATRGRRQTSFPLPRRLLLWLLQASITLRRAPRQTTSQSGYMHTRRGGGGGNRWLDRLSPELHSSCLGAWIWISGLKKGRRSDVFDDVGAAKTFGR